MSEFAFYALQKRLDEIYEAELEAEEFFGQQRQELRDTVRRQGAELARLRIVVEALVDLLHETGQVREEAVEARVEALIAARAEARRQKEAAATSEAAEAVRCAACGASVPKNRTNITGNGLVCDPCFARA